MKQLSILLLSILLSSCVATGPEFSSIVPVKSDSASIYLMRKSAFAAGAYCPRVTLDGEKVGCLKNGGYIQIYVTPGPHEIRFEKRLGEVGKEHFINFTGVPGETLFFEWLYSAEDVWAVGNFAGVTFSEAIRQYSKEQALKILSTLKKS